jgi:hypothetical protein
MIRRTLTVLALTVLCPAPGLAQSAGDRWDLLDGYDFNLLYVHSLLNYAYDLEWQANWEQRRFVASALRVNTGSVSSNQLLTDVDLNLNVELNDKWRFLGQFTRTGFRRRQVREDQLLLGIERAVGESSAIFLTTDPEFGKESMDVEAGYAWYADDREQYVRVGVRAEDMNWSSKNELGSEQLEDPIKLVWAARLELGDRSWLYSEGKFGSGYERVFEDPDLSPAIAEEDRLENTAELRLGHRGDDGRLWSVFIEYFDFEEARVYRTPGLDYDFKNRQVNGGIEHIRLLGDRHRLRILAQYVDVQGSSRGFLEHTYERQDVLAGAFYEYLRTSSGVSLAYVAGSPDFKFEALDPDESFSDSGYTDKLIVGWRYTFSKDAEIRVSLAHEVSNSGFGGGSIQYQMFF